MRRIGRIGLLSLTVFIAISSSALAYKEYAQSWPDDGSIEVYSPNNPPPDPDLSAYSTKAQADLLYQPIGSYLTDAPSDSKTYGRKNAAWEEVTTTESDPNSVHLNGDNSATFSGTVTRDGNGYITTIARTGGLTFTFTRDANNYISSFTDGTQTKTITRDGSNNITGWSVT